MFVFIWLNLENVRVEVADKVEVDFFLSKVLLIAKKFEVNSTSGLLIKRCLLSYEKCLKDFSRNFLRKKDK